MPGYLIGVPTMNQKFYNAAPIININWHGKNATTPVMKLAIAFILCVVGSNNFRRFCTFTAHDATMNAAGSRVGNPHMSCIMTSPNTPLRNGSSDIAELNTPRMRMTYIAANPANIQMALIPACRSSPGARIALPIFILLSPVVAGLSSAAPGAILA